VVRDRRGEFVQLFSALKKDGYQKVVIDGKDFNLDDDFLLIKTNKHSISVLVDRISITKKLFLESLRTSPSDGRSAAILGIATSSLDKLGTPRNDMEFRTRLTEAVEKSIDLSDGLVELRQEGINKLYSTKFACPECNISLAEIEPRMFSFNSPIGACSKCHGIGTIYQVDPKLVLNENLSVNEGGILPFNKLFFHETWYIRLLKTAAKEEGINTLFERKS